MVSFYPGPSVLQPNLEHYFKDALEEGILSENHRSDAFMALHQKAVLAVKEYLKIPENYSVYFVSSATECWEIICQDFIDCKTVHVYNGAFGEKWFQYNQSLQNKNCHGFTFNQENVLPLNLVKKENAQVIHITQNETSNGTQINNVHLEILRNENPEAFICVDATSSLGGQDLPIGNADIWFASVQKCFGLPSGMAVLICSNKSIEYSKKRDQPFYNSVYKQEQQYAKHQTTHTPNTLGIYLLNKTIEQSKTIEILSQKLREQALRWYTLFSEHRVFEPLVLNPSTRSDTVIALKGSEEVIDKLKLTCRNQGYILGNGYGKDNASTFRIANFPAHQEKDILALQHIITHF